MPITSMFSQPTRIAILGVVAVAGVAIAASTGMASSGSDERSFPISGFDRLAVAGSDNVEVTTGPQFAVVASGPARQLDRLDIKLDGKTLKIGRKSGLTISMGDDDVTIRVTMPALHGVAVAGAADVSADKGSGADFDVAVAGAGDVSIDAVDATRVSVKIAGSGDARLGGKCESLKLQVAGSGDARLQKLMCSEASITVAGSGDARANVTRIATISASGAGDVKVTGGARCTQTVTGSADVDCS